MATAVQLSLELDGNGALSVLDNFKRKWHDFVDGLKLPKSTEEGFNGIESAERRAHIAGQLFTQTLGVELPRALETVISRSQVLGPLLVGAFNVSIYAAAAVAIGEIGSKINDAMEAMAGYSEAVKAAYAETVQASAQSFTSPQSLIVGQKNLANLHEQQAENQKLEASVVARIGKLQTESGWAADVLGITAMRQAKEFFVNSAVDERVKLQGEENQILANNASLVAVRNQLEDQALAKQHQAGLQGFALARQQLEDFKNSREYQVLRGKDPDSANAAKLAHEADYNNAVIELRRQNAEQTIALRHQVEEESVTGIGKIYTSEVNALADLDRKRAESLVNEKDYQSQRGLIIARTTEQMRNAQVAILDAGKAADLFVKQREASYLTGSKKIIADAEIEKQTLINDYYKTVATVSDLGEIWNAWQNLQKKITAIDAATNQALVLNAQERARKLQDVGERQRDAEDAVALSNVADWAKAYAQIQIESEKKNRLINQQERELLLEYRGDQAAMVQITASAQEQRGAVIAQMNEQIRQENKRNVEQLGGDLESVFDDIGSGNLGKRIIANMKKLFFEILAQWILTSQQMKSAFGGIFGTLLFGPGSLESQLGGGGGAGGIGGILGGLFGASGTRAPSGTGTPAAAGASSFGGISPFGNVLGAGDPLLSAAFGNSSPLTTQSLSNGGVLSTTSSGTVANPTSGSAGQQGLFGKLFSPAAAAALLPLGLLALGSAGGKLGTAGGVFSSLLLSGKLGGLANALYGPLGLSGTGALLGGAAGGLIGFGLGESHGGILGALGGAGTGALTGLIFGGPVGALIGGAIGLISGVFGGLFGGHKRKKASQQYFSSQVQPAIQQALSQYEDHQLDYGTATANLEQLRQQAEEQLKSLKGEGKDEFNKVIAPAIDAAEKQINTDEAERSRRAGLVFGPPQFHTGGFVSTAAASAWTTKPGELLALLRQGEMVMTPQATARNRDTLEKMNAGTPGNGGGGDVHLHINAIDAASFDKWMRSGGARMISRGMTRYWNKEGNS